MKLKVLFICTHNSARSQMAEGYLNAKYGDRYEGLSAVTEVTRVHPPAIRAMEEIGIDISHHRSKALIEFFDLDLDLVLDQGDGDLALKAEGKLFCALDQHPLHAEGPERGAGDGSAFCQDFDMAADGHSSEFTLIRRFGRHRSFPGRKVDPEIPTASSLFSS